MDREYPKAVRHPSSAWGCANLEIVKLSPYGCNCQDWSSAPLVNTSCERLVSCLRKVTTACHPCAAPSLPLCLSVSKFYLPRLFLYSSLGDGVDIALLENGWLQQQACGAQPSLGPKDDLGGQSTPKPCTDPHHCWRKYPGCSQLSLEIEWGEENHRLWASVRQRHPANFSHP